MRRSAAARRDDAAQGSLIAAIDIAPSGDATEWPPTSSNNVIEQPETDRAIRMGRTVPDEVRGTVRAAVQLPLSREDGSGQRGR